MPGSYGDFRLRHLLMADRGVIVLLATLPP